MTDIDEPIPYLFSEGVNEPLSNADKAQVHLSSVRTDRIGYQFEANRIALAGVYATLALADAVLAAAHIAGGER